jgi:tRNA(Ile2) C34 agmatinyltransferase TiaS
MEQRTYKHLQAVNRKVDIAHGLICPDCGSTSTESNGSTEYRCIECDHRWGFEGGHNGEPYGF